MSSSGRSETGKGRPAALFGRTDAEALAEEVEPFRGTSMVDRARVLEQLCALAAELVAQHDDPSRTLAWQDPLPAASEALLRRLRSQARAARAVRDG